jgi:probable phosphoglycerate mutase
MRPGGCRTLPDAASARIVEPAGAPARQTPVCQHLPAASELHLDDRLREFSIGSWDGSTYDEIATRSPGIFDGEGRYEWYFRSQDGERYEAFAARIGEWLHELDEMCFLVVVTHGIVTRVLRGLYANLPRGVALVLPVPQDKIFRLSGGAIEEIAVPSCSTAGAECLYAGGARG